MVRSFRRNGRKPYGTSSSRERHDHARRQSCDTAIASFARAAEPGAWHQPQNRLEVAQARDRRGSQDRTEGTSLHGPDRGGGGGGRRVSASHAAAAGRLPLCPSTLDPASDALGAASMPAAAWHLPVTGRGRGQTEAGAVQTLSYRLLSHRHRRGADGRRQALPLRSHRPHQQVRRRPARGEGRPAHSLGVPRTPSRSRALPHSHDP